MEIRGSLAGVSSLLPYSSGTERRSPAASTFTAESCHWPMPDIVNLYGIPRTQTLLPTYLFLFLRFGEIMQLALGLNSMTNEVT